MTSKGALERIIMDVLWPETEPLLVRELMERVNKHTDRPLAYTTVQTVADRLVAKDLLVRTRHGNAWRYATRQSREDHVAALMLEALSGVTDSGLTLSRFAEGIEGEDAHRLLEALSRRALQGLKPDGTGS
ncbi:MAG: BlaI/MecI/CopY family transcriptional regulator [Streptosporangiaceae bacterium]